MKHAIKSMIFLLFLLVLCLFSCEKNTPSNGAKNDFFKENTPHKANILIEEKWEQIEFILEGERLTVTFTDSESPVYEMTEVVEDDVIYSTFQGITYESKAAFGMSGILNKVLSTIKNDTPTQSEKENEICLRKYEKEDLTFTLEEHAKTGEILLVEGHFENHLFKIKFENNT